MNSYKHIFFDLDHTLWDFNTNCRLTLDELYDRYDFSPLGFSKEEFYTVYKKINDHMWANYHKGLTTKEDIRSRRFEYTFQELGHSKTFIPQGLDDAFLSICPAKGQVFPFTHETLEYLISKGYSLHIITNGFKETQHIKLSTSGIAPYFTNVVESDVCGFMKPDKRIFDHALQLSNASSQESIMVGDDLQADIVGARNAGLAQIFINRHQQVHAEEITHEIDCLSQLKELL
ncbi:MAG TPA: YjjG family noncanonical pyrimidine nucleotidase [Cytophagaceae bacterium]|nr:YjjG family noncanonical pyrimidine nucleotidase [Cytophagaceae bacterium]